MTPWLRRWPIASNALRQAPRVGRCRLLLLLLPSVWLGCRSSRTPVVTGEAHGSLERDRIAWIALSGRGDVVPISATGSWRIDEQGGRQLLVRGTGGDPWRVERRGAMLRVAAPGGDATPWRTGPFVARATGAEGVLRANGTRYRGELWFTATDTGVLVVNRVPVEAYLRGVVPIELGTRAPGDRAALEAQAIAARSFTYRRVDGDGGRPPRRGWQMTATVQFQLYGGVEVEHPVVDAAIDATAGQVLRFEGRLVDAPYFASCGGRTAGPREAWRDGREVPYLHPVEDIDPRTRRPYCDLSEKNHWAVDIDAAGLEEAVRRALEAAGARDARPLPVLGLRMGERTPSGRAGTVLLRTGRGEITVPAREIRTVLRDVRGASLASTYFSVVRELRAGTRLAGVTLQGAGNGHGVGMCQWGAIGRARAGADARAILRHYYPGTVVGFAD